jgi:hypothetical protein
VSAWQKAVENIPKRHPAEPFDALAQEVDQLKTSLLSVDTIRSLAKSLQCSDEANCLERLESWKISVVKFVTEFKSKFSSYQDITVPMLAGVTDIMVAMQEMRTRRLAFADVETLDKLRYLLLEIDSLPEKNLDIVLAADESPAMVICIDVLRDLGRSWMSSQSIVNDENEVTKVTPKSVVFHFRDAEEPEETAGLC